MALDPTTAGAPAGRHRPRRPLDLCDPGTARAVARRAGLTPKRRLGQNLLVDRAVLEGIVEALALAGGDEVLEVGPGIGTLTVELAARARRVVAVELDRACLRALVVTLRDLDNVEVVHADVLDVDPGRLGLAPGWVAAGNIPYNITGALLAHLLERADPPSRAVLLVQREVAERLAAPPGGWSLATVAVRSLADVERVADVPPSAFDPPPAVHSSVVRVTPRRAMSDAERTAVVAMARAAFQMRRKVLRHGITRALGGDEPRAVAVLAAAGIDASRRPGTLTLEEWRALAAAAEATR